jgi:hypothetical protein
MDELVYGAPGNCEATINEALTQGGVDNQSPR